MVDTIKAFSNISANNRAFEQNSDILQEVIDHSTDTLAADAARDIMNRLQGSYLAEIGEVIGDIFDNSIQVAIDNIIMGTAFVGQPILVAVLVVRDGINIIFGVSEDIEQRYQMFSYTELSRAASRLFNRAVISNGTRTYYDASEPGADGIENLPRYLTHIAQTRILGEKMFCEWKEWGGIVGWFADNSDIEHDVNESIDKIIQTTTELKLTIDRGIFEQE